MGHETRLLRRPEVEAKVALARSSIYRFALARSSIYRFALARSSIYRLLRSGAFPEPLRVGPRAVRWSESEIDAWLAERPRATGESQAT